MQPEDLAPLAPVVELRPRWQSPWVLLATAAVVLLVLGVVFQGLGGDPRSDRIAPEARRAARSSCRPTSAATGRPTTSPPRPGWTWTATASQEKVDLPRRADEGLRRPDPAADDAEQHRRGGVRHRRARHHDRHQRPRPDRRGRRRRPGAGAPARARPGGGRGLYEPVVFDLRDGLLVGAVAEDPTCSRSGTVPVPGAADPPLRPGALHEFWVEGGTLCSSRSVDAFAARQHDPAAARDLRGGHLRVAPRRRRRPAAGGRRAACVQVPEALAPCGPAAPRTTSPLRATESRTTFGDRGAGRRPTTAYSASRARVEDDAGPSLVVDGPDGRDAELRARGRPSPGSPRCSPTWRSSSTVRRRRHLGVGSRRTSRCWSQDGRPEGLAGWRRSGEVTLPNDGDGRGRGSPPTAALVTWPRRDDGSWEAWQWRWCRAAEIAALPTGTVCFDDVDDPRRRAHC